MRRIVVCTLIICAMFTAGCKHPETKQQLTGFSDYLKDLGYSFYNPPRGDRGAGSVFRFVESESGRRSISPVCRNIFPSIQPSDTGISIPNENTSEQRNLDFVLGLLDGLIMGDPVNARISRDTVVQVQFPSSVTSYYYAEEDAKNSDGSPREISPLCFARLGELANNDGLDGVFFIYEAIEVSEVNYSIDEETRVAAGIQVPVQQIFLPKTDVEYSATSDNSLQIREPRFVAFKAMEITEFVDTGLTSAGQARVRGRPLSPSDFDF